jgi:hypothetical protein
VQERAGASIKFELAVDCAELRARLALVLDECLRGLSRAQGGFLPCTTVPTGSIAREYSNGLKEFVWRTAQAHTDGASGLKRSYLRRSRTSARRAFVLHDGAYGRDAGPRFAQQVPTSSIVLEY